MWVVVLNQFSVLEKPEVAKADDVGSLLLCLGDFEVFAWLHGKEDCHGGELSNGLLQFCDLLFCHLGNDAHGDGCLLLLFGVVVDVGLVLSL